jgi:hypothetical protein
MGALYMQEIDITIASDATQDLWNILAGASNKIILHGWELTSEELSAVLIDVNLHRVSTAGSGGASSSTEEPLNEYTLGSAASNVVTEATTPGTDAGLLSKYKWEQLGPIGTVYTPEMRPVSKVSEGFALTCNTAVVATFGGWICWEEI